MAHVTVTWQELDDDLLAATDGSTIWIDPRQTQAERRCTLAHELAHIELGHVGGCTAREEREASVLAAQWLIRLEHLADALAWTQDPHELAWELWVDLDTLNTRLEHLRPSELQYLQRRLTDGGGA